MVDEEAKTRRPIYEWNTQFISKKESVIYFTFAVGSYYLIGCKYALLCNVTKLVHILRKYEASKQKLFKKD